MAPLSYYRIRSVIYVVVPGGWIFWFRPVLWLLYLDIAVLEIFDSLDEVFQFGIGDLDLIVN